MSDRPMAERIPPPRAEKSKQKSQVISMGDYKRRELLKNIGRGALAVAANRAAQTVAGISVIGAAGKLAYDNLTTSEDQAEKMAKFPAERVFIGKASFIVSDSMNLRTEPINDPEGKNVINQVLKMGGKDVHEGDTVEIENPLVVDMETRSGIKTIWFQIPNLERRNVGIRNLIVAYAPLNNGNRANGSLFEITGIKDGSYQLKGHDPVPVVQAQVFKVNGR